MINKDLDSQKVYVVNSAIGVLLRSYTRAINIQKNRTGSLFQQKTKAKELIDENANITKSYALICANYIHQNPLKYKLVNDLNDCKFSSYLDYAGLRNGSLCNRELFYTITGIRQEEFVQQTKDLKTVIG